MPSTTRVPSLFQMVKLQNGRRQKEPVVLPLPLEGDIDVAALRVAAQRVVDRHEALRSRFVLEGDDWVVQVVDPGGLPVEIALSRTSEERVAAARVQSEVAARIDAYSAGVFAAGVVRAGLFQPRDAAWVAADHLVMDGQSAKMIVRQVVDAYNLSSEPEDIVDTPYYEFARLHRNWAKTNLRALVADVAHIGYADQLYPELDRSYVRQGESSWSTGSFSLTLDVPRASLATAEQSAGLSGITAFGAHAALFLKAYVATKGFGQDASFLTPVGFRSWPNTENTVGYFSTLGVIRIDKSNVLGHDLPRIVTVAAARTALASRVPLHLLAAAVLEPHVDFTRLKPRFPTHPAVIFDVQRTAGVEDVLKPTGMDFEPCSPNVSRHEGGALTGPAMIATVNVSSRPGRLSLVCSANLDESQAYSLLRRWATKYA